MFPKINAEHFLPLEAISTIRANSIVDIAGRGLGSCTSPHHSSTRWDWHVKGNEELPTADHDQSYQAIFCFIL